MTTVGHEIWREKIKKGKVTIDENEFLCEKIKLFDENFIKSMKKLN